jgi:hypothetical protein
MKGCKVPLFMVSLFGFSLLSTLDVLPAHADFAFGTPTNLGPAINSSAIEASEYLSADGLEFYFTRQTTNTRGDIWVARRPTRDSVWGPAAGIGAPVNSADNWDPFLTADGLTLLFDGMRPGGFGYVDLWITTRATKSDIWGTPVNLGDTVNSPADDWCPSLSADGLELYFTSGRAGGSGLYDLWMTTRASVNDNWGTPTNLGSPLNTSSQDTCPSISPDGLVLFFASNRSGVSGPMDLFMTRRATTKDPWGPPKNLGPTVNSDAVENAPMVSADGSLLFFYSDRQGGYGSGDIWQAPILPVLDFNGDGKVDIKDLMRLIESWDKNDPSVDIAPYAWGDGKIDEKDLEVLMSCWGQEVEDPTLLAYWALDESKGSWAEDSLLVHNGTVYGDPVWQPTGGFKDGALQLDGVNDYVGTPFVLNPNSGPFSVFAWVQGSVPGKVILSQKGGANWLLTDSSGNLMTELKALAGGKTLTSPTVITDGQWHRVGLSWDGTNRVLYVDDEEVKRDTQAYLATSNNGLYLGAGKGLESTKYWSGLIDDVRIFNRAVKP